MKNYLLEKSRKYNILSKDEQNECFYNYKTTKNPKCKEILAMSNIKFVFKTALYYHKKTRINLDDLFSEGISGLLRGIEGDEYDISRGIKFYSYASHWIKFYITRYISEKSKTIRIPVNKVTKINKYIYSNKKLDKELEHLINLNNFSKLDGKAIGEGFLSFNDVLPSKNKTIETIMMEKEQRKHIFKIINNLSNEEKKIVKRYFGFEFKKLTINQICSDLSMKRMDVEKYLATALRKIRKSVDLHLLFD